VSAVRTRREPPPLRAVAVRRVEPRSPRLKRVTMAGDGLAGYEPGLPGGSVRLLLPRTSGELVLPTWTGNDYRFGDGTRATIRTLTPLRYDADGDELDLEVVCHGAGPLSEWAATAHPGAVAAVSGPGRGYEVDADARSFLLAGDETALPALGLLVAAVPTASEVQVLVEIAEPSARIDLPVHPGLTVAWHEQADGAAPGEALTAAVLSCRLETDMRIWVAGEAAAMQRIRRHLFETCGVPRSRAVVRGYWKHGRAGGDDPD
jgi:NADPH-dependent ferric siderophore reductase